MYDTIVRDNQVERESRLKEQALRKRQIALVGIMSANIKALCNLWISDYNKREETYNLLNSLVLCGVELIAGWKVRPK